MRTSSGSSWIVLQYFKMVRHIHLSLHRSVESLQDTARLFNTSPISPRRCRTLLTKIAVLVFTGEKFPTNEATTLFFGISKLFQNKDPSLRQMVYLIIKELAHTAEDVIMSTSIIMKDMSMGSDIIYRANAIRALCRIIDVCSGCPSCACGSEADTHRLPLFKQLNV